MHHVHWRRLDDECHHHQSRLWRLHALLLALARARQIFTENYFIFLVSRKKWLLILKLEKNNFLSLAVKKENKKVSKKVKFLPSPGSSALSSQPFPCLAFSRRRSLSAFYPMRLWFRQRKNAFWLRWRSCGSTKSGGIRRHRWFNGHGQGSARIFSLKFYSRKISSKHQKTSCRTLA